MTVHDDAQAAARRVYDDALAAQFDAGADSQQPAIVAIQDRLDDALAALEAAQATPLTYERDGWALMFADEFQGTTVDETTWDVKDRYGMNGRDDVAMRANVSIIDERLRMVMRQETATSTAGATRNITSALMLSKRLLPNEFLMEFRARVNWQAGFWPGWVWLTNATIQGGGGELDPYECFYKHRSPKVTLHSRAYGAGHLLDPRTIGPEVGARLTEGGWNTVRVEKRTKRVTVAYNDTPVAEFRPGSKAWDPAYWENPAHQWSLRVNLQSGGAGGSVDATTDFGKCWAELDYLRVWTPT